MIPAWITRTDEEEEIFTRELRLEVKRAGADHVRFMSLYDGRGPLRRLIEYGEVDAEALKKLGCVITELP